MFAVRLLALAPLASLFAACIPVRPQSGVLERGGYVNRELGFLLALPGDGWRGEAPADPREAVVRFHRAVEPGAPVYQVEVILDPHVKAASDPLGALAAPPPGTLVNRHGIRFWMACGGAPPTCRFRFFVAQGAVTLHVAVNPAHAQRGDAPAVELSPAAKRALAELLADVRPLAPHPR